MNRLGDQCTGYVIPKSIGQLQVPSGSWTEWAFDHNGAEGEFTKISVTVKGAENDVITVTGLDFEVTERTAPIAGSYVYQGCGSDTVARFAVVDLDLQPPRIMESSAVERTWGDEEWRTTPLKFPYKVTNTDTETLLIIGKTKKHVAWRGKLSWTNGDKSETETIDFRGEPFHTSSPSSARWYLFSKGRWVPSG